MANVQSQGIPVNHPAGEDLTAYQWNIVKMNTSGQLEHFDAITDIPYGILQNAPNTGEQGKVIPVGCGGASKIALGATLTPGARIAGSAAGLAVAAATTSYPIGILDKGGASGDLGTVRLVSLTVMA